MSEIDRLRLLVAATARSRVYWRRIAICFIILSGALACWAMRGR